jgi:hypothetical protein
MSSGPGGGWVGVHGDVRAWSRGMNNYLMPYGGSCVYLKISFHVEEKKMEVSIPRKHTYYNNSLSVDCAFRKDVCLSS